jgi:hypothetical protein
MENWAVQAWTKPMSLKIAEKQLDIFREYDILKYKKEIGGENNETER